MDWTTQLVEQCTKVVSSRLTSVFSFFRLRVDHDVALGIPVGKIAKKKTVFVNSALKIQCHIVKTFLPTGI